MIRIVRDQSDQINRAKLVRFRFDDQIVEGTPGDSVAAALCQSGHFRLRTAPVDGAPRGMFCCMGLCQECTVLVNGEVVEACRLQVESGLEIKSLDDGTNR